MGWQDTSIVFGGAHSYRVYQQHDLNNCGPSSIVMLIHYALDRRVAIGFVQMLCGKMEPGRGVDSGRTSDERWHDWGVSGETIGWVLLDALRSKWPALNAYENPVAGATAQFRACTAASPALARVGWNGGGGHFIVCVGASGPNMIYLDPYFGIVVAPNVTSRTGGGLRYSTARNSFGKGTNNGVVTYGIFTNPS